MLLVACLCPLVARVLFSGRAACVCANGRRNAITPHAAITTATIAVILSCDYFGLRRNYILENDVQPTAVFRVIINQFR